MVLYNDNVNCLLEQLEPKGIQVLLDYGPTVRKLFSNFFSKEGNLRKQAHKLLDKVKDGKFSRPAWALNSSTLS